MLEHKRSPYVLLSYPRSGSNYMEALLFLRFGLIVNRCRLAEQIPHNDSFIIGIIRDPIGCTASIIATKSRFGEVEVFSPKWNEQYIDGISEIEKHSDIIVSFDELASNPESVVQKISKITGLRLFDNGYDVSVVNGDEFSHYLPTSTVLPNYNQILEDVSLLDFTGAMEAYNRVLAKAI